MDERDVGSSQERVRVRVLRAQRTRIGDDHDGTTSTCAEKERGSPSLPFYFFWVLLVLLPIDQVLLSGKINN